MKRYIAIGVTTHRVQLHVVLQVLPILVVRPLTFFERLAMWAQGKRATVSAWMLDATHWRARGEAKRLIEKAKA